jgi:hypothetical protein
MKNLVLVLISCLGLQVQAKTIKETANDSLIAASMVERVIRAYSKSSSLDVKVVELLGGDGMNPTRMLLVLDGAYVYDLGIVMLEVRRVVVSGIDEITINYSQDSIDENDNNIVVKKSMKLKVTRDSRGNPSDLEVAH